MNDHVFQCRSENVDPKQFAVTLETLYHYANTNFKSASDLGSIFSQFTPLKVKKSDNPEKSDDPVDDAIFKEDIKEYIKRRNMLKDNIKKLHSVVWGQSSKAMR